MSKNITIACDHAGYDLKNALKKEILNMGKLFSKEESYQSKLNSRLFDG